MNIILIEDDIKIGTSVEKGLRQENYQVKLVKNGIQALDEISKFYDLAIIDIMIPEVLGIDIAKELKKINPKTKIIFLTSKSSIEDKLKGFEIGADDYITKPFSFDELVARVRAVLKRETESSKIAHKDLILDLEKNILIRNNINIELSKKEFELLKFLIINKNKVFSKEDIIEKVWGYDSDILENTIEVFIKSIRDKIEKPFNLEKVIHTVRGFGYTIKDDR